MWVAPENSLTLNGLVTGTGALRKQGNGTLTLTGANTYSGGTTISAGVVNVQNGGALGTNAVSVASDAALGLQGAFTVANALTLNGTGVSNGGALRNVAGDKYYGGPITLGSDTRINSGSGILQIDGAIGGAGQTLTVGGAGVVIINNGLNTGTGALIKDGVGVLALNSVNTFTGSVTVNAGTLQLSFAAGGPVNSAIGDTSAVVLNGGTISVRQNETIGSLSGAAGTSVSIRGTTTLTAGGDDTSTTYSGVISDTGGPGSLTKTGTGTFTLTGANTYTGATTVSGGTLLVNGSTASSSGLTVDLGGTVGGNGILPDTIVNGTLSAGNSPGTLTVAGDLTLNPGSTSLFELNTPGIVGGVSNDLVNVTGNLALDGTLQTPGAVSGFYRLFNVGGTISGGFATVPAGGTVITSVPNQVNLLFNSGGQLVQFWDGADMAGNGTVDGGTGTWTAANTNWTGAPGNANFNAPWQSQVGVFAGAAGTVTVSGPVAFEGIQFSTVGYTITGDALR